MNLAEFKGLKGAGITILWLVEKTTIPFRKSDFLHIYADKAIASAFASLESAGLITPFEDEYYVVSEEYKALVEIPTLATTAYINNIINLKEIKSKQQWSVKQRVIYDALREFGIGRSVSGELLGCDHITIEYIEAHITQAKKDGISKGIFVTRVRDNDPAPNGQKPYDPEQYTNGKYKDFIKS